MAWTLLGRYALCIASVAGDEANELGNDFNIRLSH